MVLREAISGSGHRAGDLLPCTIAVITRHPHVLVSGARFAAVLRAEKRKRARAWRVALGPVGIHRPSVVSHANGYNRPAAASGGISRLPCHD